jgi:hypothetical protein
MPRLSGGATPKEVRQALRDLYPWGERQHHPYRMWCAEVRLELATRFPKPKEPEKPAEVAFVFRGGKRRWWLDVRCDWCRAMRKTHGVLGCLACGPYHDAINLLVNSDEWPGWLDRLNADSDAAPLVLADWLTDNGHPEALAALFRAAGRWEGETPCPV